MNFNLILPVAIDKPEYEKVCPYLWRETEDGKLPVLEGLRGIDLNCFSDIYIVLLQKHENLYHLAGKLSGRFPHMQYRGRFHVVFLDSSTLSQTETVYRTIRQEGIEGSLMVKDADNYFSCDVIQGNGVAIYPLDALERVNPQNKSYVTLDDFFNVTNIIEKKIIGRYFCVGGYFFKDVSTFVSYYEKSQKYHPFYMSFLIFSMLLDGIVFRPFFVENYQDWGTWEDWRYYLENEGKRKD